MKKLIVILGPTSTGKTDLAINLAKRFRGELVSADSRQVYKGLNIGAGKLPATVDNFKKGRGYWVVNGINIHMYDVADPTSQYNVAAYIKHAKKVIKKICKTGSLPILVGGTGLYIKALLEGLSYLNIPINTRFRKELEQLTLWELQDMLKDISPKKWQSLNTSDSQNLRRLVRAIELERNAKNHKIKRDNGLAKEFNVLKIGLTAPRSVLYHRSDKRVVSRLTQGMIEEAENLNKEGLSLERMKQLGLEYGILADYLNKKIASKDQLTKILQNKIRSYIRRQLTWFKKEKAVLWIDITKRNYLLRLEKLVSTWYDSSTD